MAKRSFGVTLFGVLFLIIGCAWLTTIVKRNEPFFDPVHARTMAAVKNSGTPRDILRTNLEDIHDAWTVFFREAFRPVALPREMAGVLAQPRAHIRSWHIILFWITALVELLCAFAYVVGGIAFLRRYAFAGRWGVMTLFMDAAFKGMIVFYMEYAALPLQPAVGGNILENYYLGFSGVWLHLSAYFTGLVFYQPYWFIYLVMFVVYVLFGGYYFSREDIRDEFCRPQRRGR